jgi:hypothetical protein
MAGGTMSADESTIDTEQRPFLTEGLLMTHFLTAPLDRGAGIRCCMRDPGGYVIEVGQATGLVEGRLAEQAAAGREAGCAGGR